MARRWASIAILAAAACGGSHDSADAWDLVDTGGGGVRLPTLPAELLDQQPLASDDISVTAAESRNAAGGYDAFRATLFDARSEREQASGSGLVVYLENSP
ncbi:MAG TPA: hypothetical protein VGM88_01520 [Kofleriaceae bacterium]|jgi:hypothetical protein